MDRAQRTIGARRTHYYVNQQQPHKIKYGLCIEPSIHYCSLGSKSALQNAGRVVIWRSTA